MNLLRMFKGYRKLERKIEYLKAAGKIIKVEGNQEILTLKGLDKLKSPLFIEGNKLLIRDNRIDITCRGKYPSLLVWGKDAVIMNNVVYRKQG